MQTAAGLVAFRMLPVFFIVAAAIAYVFYVEGSAAYPIRNSVPMLAATGLALFILKKGSGRWTGAGWRWPLGLIGFAVPALGLSIYLHYGYSVDLDGMYSESVYPQELFKYLPLYTCFAGCIGFAIGWIVGRNV